MTVILGNLLCHNPWPWHQTDEIADVAVKIQMCGDEEAIADDVVIVLNPQASHQYIVSPP
jgi:hypothetical protein